MMAFVGAGRADGEARVLAAQRAAMAGDGDNRAFTAEVGHAAALALQAFGRGDYASAVRLLRPIRSHAHRFGGSHAQRDLLDLTLVEAALRGGDPVLVGEVAKAIKVPESYLRKVFQVLARAGLMLATWAPTASWLIWVAVAFSAVSLLLNSITTSTGERLVWVPVAIVMLASSLAAALLG